MRNASGNGQPTGRIDFDEMKLAFPLRDVMMREVGYGRQGQSMFRCPFHEDSSPSLSIFSKGSVELFKCHSGQCSESGSVLDFVWRLHPELRNRAAETLAYLNSLTGRAVEALREAPRGRNPRPHATERHEAGGTVVEHRAIRPVSMEEVYGRHEQLLKGVAYEEARRYAEGRSWLVSPDRLYGTEPYPVGVGRWNKGWLSQHALPAIPKLVRTSRLAFLLGREEEFERKRELCIGVKLRLTDSVFDAYWAARAARNPDTDPEELRPSRWWCQPGFSVTPPGEVDANEEAEVLVICEGPGDAIRLYHEAHSSERAAARFGARWHITYEENAGTWTSASLERRARKVPTGGKNFRLEPVSFFDGYRLVILLFDSDAGGREASAMARWHAHRQAPRTHVKNVALPEGMDLSEFFDSGRCIYDLGELIQATSSTRGIDDPNEPAPLTAAQRRKQADEGQHEPVAAASGWAGRVAA